MPRYKSSNGKSVRGGSRLLTTPMKKVLVYVLALSLVFAMIRISFWGSNKEPELRLVEKTIADSLKQSSDAEYPGTGSADGAAFLDGGANANAKLGGNGNGKGAIEGSVKDNAEPKRKVPKEQFNNEVAKQQEVKNLEKEYKPPVPKNQVNNEVKNKIET